MPQILLFVPLLAAALAAFLPDADSPGRKPWREVAFAWVAVLALSLVAFAGYQAMHWDPKSLTWGIGATLLLVPVAALDRPALVWPVALALTAWINQTPTMEVVESQLVVASFLGLGAIAFRSYSAALLAVVSGGLLAATYLGGAHLEQTNAVGIAATIALFPAVVGATLGKLGNRRELKSLAMGLTVAGGAFFVTRWMSVDGTIATSVLLGALGGGVVGWLLPDGEDETSVGLRISLSALIWLGIGSITFGNLRGFGMSLALLGALATLTPFRNPRALLTLGPLAGLVLYRLLRDSHPEASRALDIGQHYALVGLAIGALIPTLPADAIRRQKGAVGAFLWMVVLLGVPILVHLLFGSIGAVGFIAGVGFAGMIYAYRNGKELLALAVGLGMAAETVLLSGRIGDFYGLTRDEKVRVIVMAAVGLVVLGSGLFVLGRRTTAEAQS